MKLIRMVLGAFAVIFIGFLSAVVGLFVGAILFTMLIPEMVFFGKEGYEAGGPIGFILGGLAGLIVGGLLLFRQRMGK